MVYQQSKEIVMVNEYPLQSGRLHDGSSFVTSFQIIACHLYRRKAYLQTKDYLKDKIPWEKIMELTNGRYELNDQFYFMEPRESRKRKRK